MNELLNLDLDTNYVRQFAAPFLHFYTVLKRL